jgi:O-antigen ligase
LIEKGIASREEGEGGLWARWNGVRFQLQNHLDPNGHSLLQRIEYWKTAWKIILNHWLIGVGTGDVQQAFEQQYERDNSQLLPEYRLRAHNTYLTSWVSFGLLGLLLLVWMIFSFLKTSLKRSFALGFVFMMVAATTFLLEDTLETQMGASFFAFFFGIALIPFTHSEESKIS